MAPQLPGREGSAWTALSGQHCYAVKHICCLRHGTHRAAPPRQSDCVPIQRTVQEHCRQHELPALGAAACVEAARALPGTTEAIASTAHQRFVHGAAMTSRRAGCTSVARCRLAPAEHAVVVCDHCSLAASRGARPLLSRAVRSQRRYRHAASRADLRCIQVIMRTLIGGDRSFATWRCHVWTRQLQSHPS